MTIDETIETLQNKKISLARFGDGEISIMNQSNGVGFQKQDPKLCQKLNEVFSKPLETLLIALPDPFQNLRDYNRIDRKFWVKFTGIHKLKLLNKINMNLRYGNAHITRFYISNLNKKMSDLRFTNLKMIWKNRDILIVEGSYTRSGVGNDLYKDAKSISRVICPKTNAFDLYDGIYSEVLKHGKDKLILISLGPTATVLAYDLAAFGYWAIDIGHLDVEYIWMKSKAKRKSAITGRHVNEIVQGEIHELDQETLAIYNQQIIAKLI